jgi:HupE / UreJ protein
MKTRAFISVLVSLATLAALMVTTLVTTNAFAHKASDSYLTLERNGNEIRGQWDIALRDLDVAIGVDSNNDGVLQWQEVKAKHNEIAGYALSRLTLTANELPCRLNVTEQLLDRHTDGAYSVLRLKGRCEANAGTLKVDYRLLFDIDAQHRGLLKLTELNELANNEQTTSAIFSVEKPTLEFAQNACTGKSIANTLPGFVADGIKHIAIGFDHILFLIALLLPAVMIRNGRKWQPVTTLPKAVIGVASIVTAFTVAHSITLSLATLGIVSVPSRWVESLIAASVAITAIDNVVPCFPKFLQQRRWLVAFAFGLIHGFGFASVLQELNLPRTDLVLSLIGFNVGVEIGQLALVAMVLPVIYMLRTRAAYPRFAVTGGSLLIFVVASGWFLERALHLEFMPL